MSCYVQQMSRSRLKCTVAYEGSEYQGWQVQPGCRTIQQVIEQGMEQIQGGVSARIHGSGRTDAGVHARGQVFHVDVERSYTTEKWREALNAVLPGDVRIQSVEIVDPEFHARFDAVSKEYRYFMWLGPVCPPELRRIRHHIRSPLNLGQMEEAAHLLQGKHDFRSFSAVRVDADEDTVRTIRKLELSQQGHELILTAEAPGFLYKMVRQLTGALLRVGRGELTLSEVKALRDHPRVSHDAPSAPALGLFLWQVGYGEGEM